MGDESVDSRRRSPGGESGADRTLRGRLSLHGRTHKEGYALLCTGNFDLAVVDIKLEDGISGLDVVHKAKEGGNTTPTIFLSAMSDPTIKSRGLDFGADDYLAKPYETVELLARVNAVRRRSGGDVEVDGKLVFEDIVVNLVDHTAKRGERPLELTALELHLLEYLIRNRGRICSAETILSRVWNYNATMDRNLVEQKIRALRKKLTANGERDPIHNERCLGHVLK